MKDKLVFPKLAFKDASKIANSIKLWCQVNKIYGQEVKGQLYKSLVNLLVNTCSTSKQIVTSTTAESILSHMLGSVATPDNTKYLAEFVGANITDIRLNKRVMPGTIDGSPGWVALQIVDMDRNGSKLDIACKILNGPFYGRLVIKSVEPMGMAIRMLFRKTGVITRRRRFALPRDLVQMYLFAEVSNGQYGLTFRTCDINSYLRTRNNQLIKERQTPCIKGFERICSKCPIGYNECHRGVRAVTLTINKVETHDRLPDGCGGEGMPRNCGQVLDQPTA